MTQSRDSSDIRIAVIGSVNLDLAVRVARLPTAGETITDGKMARYPGGKGANQALAARRLGADVSLVACVGRDANADEALHLLREGGVDLSACVSRADASTGVAFICIDDHGENQIVVAPGANRLLDEDDVRLQDADALICQLEVPVATIAAVADSFDGLFCVNLAPAMPVPDAVIHRADVLVVNQTEARYYGAALEACRGYVVETLGAGGAVARANGQELARAAAPAVEVVDTTGAGDTFTAALTLALAQKLDLEQSLRFACAAGALATTRMGAQPSLPTIAEVRDLLAGC